MLVRKLKLKYIDMNPAFDKDPWVIHQRELFKDEKSQAGSRRSPGRLGQNDGASISNTASQFNRTQSSFRYTSLPKIRGTMAVEETIGQRPLKDILRKSVQSLQRKPVAPTQATVDMLNSTPAKRLLNFIVMEVQKFMQNKRLNEENIKELDQRIHYETFIREKKDAILEDRKNNVQEEDQQSHVSAVKTKYQALGQLVEQRSIANGMAKSIASMKSQAKNEGSMAGSQVQLNNRMDRDFPVA